MLEPRRLQGELRAPLWNPRHTGYVTPNAVHAFAARARDYAHGCRSCREKSLAPDHARFDSELASHGHPAIHTTRSAGVERSSECSAAPTSGGSPLRCFVDSRSRAPPPAHERACESGPVAEEGPVRMTRWHERSTETPLNGAMPKQPRVSLPNLDSLALSPLASCMREDPVAGRLNVKTGTPSCCTLTRSPG